VNLREQFGAIDRYLFDQLLRGRISPGMKVLDAGCGGAIAEIRRLATGLPPDNFRHEALENLSFPAAFADTVIASAVLHFAQSHDHFRAMLWGAWNTLKPGGLFFSRLASSIGIESRITPAGNGRYLLPDGSERYLVDEACLVDLTRQLGGRLADPLKTTVVQNQRAMTTWVIRKAHS
jgi:2-polyprenyl-3-methyl-5-hydroxy-6-metoxy-1,4-benzoquinol methylase